MKLKKLSKKQLLLLVVGILVFLVLLGFYSPLVLTKYDITDEDLPSEFDGFKIVQITDFHCKEFGENEEDLIDMVASCQPDIICLTGDIVDEAHTTENAEDLLKGIADIAPIYYVTGNHEFYENAPYAEFKTLCAKYGVEILESETKPITKDGATILISGLDFYEDTTDMITKLGFADTDYYNLLLYHDSSKFDFMSSFDYDLILCGHIHGGIIRLPFIGGLLGSDYLFFPEYDYGVFTKYNSTMISSSGLGDARIPRWNNPREVVEITLHSQE